VGLASAAGIEGAAVELNEVALDSGDLGFELTDV